MWAGDNFAASASTGAMADVDHLNSGAGRLESNSPRLAGDEVSKGLAYHVTAVGKIQPTGATLRGSGRGRPAARVERNASVRIDAIGDHPVLEDEGVPSDSQRIRIDGHPPPAQRLLRGIHFEDLFGMKSARSLGARKNTDPGNGHLAARMVLEPENARVLLG